MEQQKSKKLKFDYSWIIIGLCFLIIFTTLGFCSSGRTLYLTAITDALGFGRGAFSLNDTFRFATSTIVNIFFGFFVNKFGFKNLIIAGFLCLIGFALINSYANELWMFYVAGVLLGIGLAWTTTTMMSAIINVWCKGEHKGKITGIILSANGLGGALSVQLLEPIIFNPNNIFGYRDSYRIVAIILAVVLALVVILFRNRPKGAEKTIIQKKQRKARGRSWVGMEYKDALKKPYFYLAVLCIAFTGMALQCLGHIGVPYYIDLGINTRVVATISSFSSIIMMFAKIFVGFMFDKKGVRVTMNICFICSIVSLSTLPLVANTTLGISICFVRSVIGTIAIPLETVMIPLYASELFGKKSFLSIVGVFMAANYVGYAIGSPLGNFIYDAIGNYVPAFILCAVLMVFVFITMQFVVKASRKERAIIEQANLLENQENAQ